MSLASNHKILRICVVALFFLTPLESISIGGEDSTFSIIKLYFLVLLGVWIFSGVKMQSNKLINTFLVLFAYYILTLPFSVSVEHSQNRLLLQILPTLFLCLILSGYIKEKKEFLLILISYVGGIMLLCYNLYISRTEILLNAVNEYGQRVTALGHDENELSFLLSMGVVVCMHSIIRVQITWIKLLSFLVIVIMSFFIISTGSRTGVLILVTLFTIFFLSYYKSAKRKFGMIWIIPLVILTGIYIISFIPDSVISRIFETREQISSGDLSGRGDIWQKSFEAFLNENIIFGVGFDNFSEMYNAHVGIYRASHNTYLSHLIGGGIVGFGVFLYILSLIWKYCKKIYRNTGELFIFAYYLPILIIMFTLETTSRRWLYLIGVLLYKWYSLTDREKLIIDTNKVQPYDSES